MSAIRIATYFEIGDQATRVVIRWRGLVNVHDGAELVHSDQLPTAAVMVACPSAIQHMREAEVTVLGSR